MSELAVGSLSGLAANSYVIDVASGSQLTQPGMVLAVQSVTKTDAFSVGSVATTAGADVTGLSITYEPTSTSNKLLISASFGVAASSTNNGAVGIGVYDGSSLIGVGDAAGSRTQVGAGARTDDGGDAGIGTSPMVQFLHTPGAGSKTYTVQVINISGSSRTLYVNRTPGDTDSANNPRGISTLTIMEVAV